MKMKTLLAFVLTASFFCSRQVSACGAVITVARTFPQGCGTTCLAFAPDNQTIVCADESNTVKFLDAKTGNTNRVIHFEEPVLAAAWSPETNMLAVRCADGVHLMQADSGEELRKLPSRTEGTPNVAFSPTGQLVATGDSMGYTHIWDTSSGAEMYKYSARSHPIQSFEANPEANASRARLVSAVAFGPDRRFVYSTAYGDGGSLLSYDLMQIFSCAMPRPYRWVHAEDKGWRVVATPNGSNVVSLTTQGKIRVLDERKGEVIAELNVGDESRDLAISDDGKFLAATAGKTIKLWRMPGMEQLPLASGHSDTVLAISFSPDSKTLASTSKDGSLRLWKLPAR